MLMHEKNMYDTCNKSLYIYQKLQITIVKLTVQNSNKAF